LTKSEISFIDILIAESTRLTGGEARLMAVLTSAEDYNLRARRRKQADFLVSIGRNQLKSLDLRKQKEIKRK
jgi:hypothetical protein